VTAPLEVEVEDELDDLEPEPRPEPMTGDRLLETLLAQASPFADHLTSALAEPFVLPLEQEPPAATATVVDEPVVEAAAVPEPQSEPEPMPPRRRPTAAPAPAAAPAERMAPFDDIAQVRRDLVAAAVPVRLVGELLAEVERSLRPFEPDVPVRELTRRALAQRIPVATGWTAKRRTVALVGLRGSGRTLAAAGLCAAFVRDGRSVAAISMEPARRAFELAQLTSAEAVEFHVADAPDLAARARGLVRDAEVVVVDTPPLADAIDGNRLAATLELLRALKPDETHLVLPATASLEDARTLVESLLPHRLPARLIVSHVDEPGAGGVPVGLALAHRIPVSFVADGTTVGALRPAAPESLARMVLQ
jgi:SRP54 family protein